jgi:hypothetical protein
VAKPKTEIAAHLNGNLVAAPTHVAEESGAAINPKYSWRIRDEKTHSSFDLGYCIDGFRTGRTDKR